MLNNKKDTMDSIIPSGFHDPVVAARAWADEVEKNQTLSEELTEAFSARDKALNAKRHFSSSREASLAAHIGSIKRSHADYKQFIEELKVVPKRILITDAGSFFRDKGVFKSEGGEFFEEWLIRKKVLRKDRNPRKKYLQRGWLTLKNYHGLTPKQQLDSYYDEFDHEITEEGFIGLFMFIKKETMKKSQEDIDGKE